MNLPNALTVLRIALVPVLAWCMAMNDPASLRWAALVFVVAAATDVADGAIARRRVREIGVTLLRLAVLRRAVIPASRGGKAKTFAQFLAIVMLLVADPTGAWGIACAVVVLVAVALTVVTGVDYVVRARAVMRSGAVRP